MKLQTKTEYLAWAARAQLFANAALAYANGLPEDGEVSTQDEGSLPPPPPPPPGHN